MAAMLGAMFSPVKQKLITRIVIAVLLLIPCLVLIPLSFAVSILFFLFVFILGLTIFGIRISLELLIDGIPEIDKDGNLVEPGPTHTAPWV